MKKNRMIKACMALFLIFGMFIMPVGQLKVQAAEVIATVEGTVMSGTTSELLLLSTKEGKMEIKLDSDTDTSGCKILLPDYKVYVSVSHGSDGYLHAVKITSNAQTTGVSVDTASAATVAGTIDKKTTGDVLYVNTPQGEMQIKLDGTTDMSGCKILMVGESYTIVCARGSDAYMHAISISSGVAANVASSFTPAPAGAVTASTTSVIGTVNKKTKENLLYLATSGGEMQIPEEVLFLRLIDLWRYLFTGDRMLTCMRLLSQVLKLPLQQQPLILLPLQQLPGQWEANLLKIYYF